MLKQDTPEVCLIWTQTPDGAIGRDGAIPWHSKKDFTHFRKATLGYPVIMGRKTWESLPHRPLPGRLNIVVSSQPLELEGALAAKSLDEALVLAREGSLYQAFVIGGASLYEQAMPLASRVFRTIVDAPITDADTFAPTLDESWALAKERSDIDNGLWLEFAEYVRTDH